MVRNRFDQQLAKLNDELTVMGALCEDAVNFAIKAVFDNDMDMAARAKAAEQQIDQMEKDIESMCMRLLLQQHPVARDLRVISSALKMISDMERIGDQAADIAEIAKYLEGSIIPGIQHLKSMSEYAAEMVTRSIDSFVESDLDMAVQVIKDDDVVDRAFDEVREDLLCAIGEGTIDGKILLDLLMIAKYIERVGDHATNIAEWVVYSITGAHPEETN
ncbi:MAG: phosphate signaling complex protein PhoU [Firmicutes bacterium]|nr:phosphate signaling complex protein PhoU [Bacillota bacterium]